MTQPANDPAAVEALAEALLAVAVSSLNGYAPTRQAVVFGPPAWDCEQVTVNVGAIRASGVPLTASQGRPVPCHMVTVVDFEVSLVLCVDSKPGPKGEPPPVADLQGDATKLNTAGHSMWVGLRDAFLAGTLFPSLPCSAYTWRGMVPVGPLGGKAGWLLKVEVALA